MRLDSKTYSAEVKKTLAVVLVLNWIVALAKIIVGSLIKSTSMVADGYHSFADGTSNIVGLLGMRIASQPVDEGHPYGHKKYETFSSVLIALLLFVLCFHIVHDSFEKFTTKQAPQVNLFSFFVMGVTLVINFFVMSYEFMKGKRIGSDVLVSDSLHTRADILTSLSVVVALVGVKFGWPILDSIAALVIVVFIGAAAINIIRESSDTLCDSAVIDIKEIERRVLGVPGVLKCHRIRTRGRKDDIYIDLHVLLDDKISLVNAHEISTQIERILKKSIDGVSDVVIHIEPLSSGDGDKDE